MKNNQKGQRPAMGKSKMKYTREANWNGAEKLNNCNLMALVRDAVHNNNSEKMKTRMYWHF